MTFLDHLKHWWAGSDLIEPTSDILAPRVRKPLGRACHTRRITLKDGTTTVYHDLCNEDDLSVPIPDDAVIVTNTVHYI